MRNKKSWWKFLKKKKKKVGFEKKVQRFFNQFKKKRKKIKIKKRIVKFFSWTKKEKNRKTEKRRLLKLILIWLILIVILFFLQIIQFSKDLIRLEALESNQNVQTELKAIEKQVLEIETDFKINIESFQWEKIKNRQLLAEKIRHLNYLNSHLSKTIEAYNQDTSLQFYRKKLGNLEKIFQESQNVELISERIASKIDILLLFDQVDKNQKELLGKDFNLFYEKIDLIDSFGFSSFIVRQSQARTD